MNIQLFRHNFLFEEAGLYLLWLLGASKVVGVDHRRTSSSSAFCCCSWRLDGVAGDRSREISGVGNSR
jgi:hypothetical protein